MTLEQLFAMPVGMELAEYEKLLNEKARLEKKIKKARLDIDFAYDALAVLADEEGSDRYNKHLHVIEDKKFIIYTSEQKLNTIKKKLKGR